MERLLIYVHNIEKSTQLLKFVNLQISHTVIEIVTVIDMVDEQTAFLSLNNSLINEYRNNAQNVLDACFSKLNTINRNLQIVTSILEGNISESISRYAKDNDVTHIIIDSEQEKKYKIVCNLLNLKTPITVIPT